MEPGIQYAMTSDGVNIAYHARGAGQAAVLVPTPLWSQLQQERHMPECRPWVDSLGRNRLLVTYDCRGCGLSDRGAREFSVEALTLDLEAVMDQARLETAVLFGSAHSGPVAISYAARHPDRVSHLILLSSIACGDRRQDSESAASRALVNLDWKTYTEVYARARLGWSAGDLAERYAAAMRESVSSETAQAFYEWCDRWDISALMPAVRARTLVIHQEGLAALPLSEAKILATGIPEARLLVLPGPWVMPWFEDSSLSAIHEFLGDDSDAPARSGLAAIRIGEASSGMTAILFADIADSTALTERLGDAAFRAKARELDGALRTLIRAHAGTPIEGKLLGDGVLAVFTSARQAIEAALACGAAGSDAGLPLHLGLHAGDVIREENNVYGGAVNIAARISGLSAPGEVLVSDTVRSLARTSAGARFEDRGEQALKGVGEAVRVWAVRQEEETGNQERG